MPYNPKGFSDIPGLARMAPSEMRPPLNFSNGGAVSWAGDASVYNTQSQLGNIMATPGGFGGMARQFTIDRPLDENRQTSPLANQAPQMPNTMGASLQPKPVPPATVPLANMPPASMAKGGKVENLVTRLREEFSKRGLDFDKFLQHRLKQMGKA